MEEFLDYPLLPSVPTHFHLGIWVSRSLCEQRQTFVDRRLICCFRSGHWSSKTKSAVLRVWAAGLHAGFPLVPEALGIRRPRWSQSLPVKPLPGETCTWRYYSKPGGWGLKHHAGQLKVASSLLAASVTWPIGPPPQAKRGAGRGHHGPR